MKKVLVFDIGGTNTRLALVNENFKIEKRLDTKTIKNDEKKFMENCIKMIEQFPLEDVVAIGAGIPGVVDTKTGDILIMPNASLKNIKFAKILKEKFNLPVYVRNDAQVACLGEAYSGAGKGLERVFFITISTGLGGALCVDKEIQDYLTEVGHTLFNYKGQIRGFEESVSGINLSSFAKELGYDVKDAIDFFDKVRAKDKKALQFYNEWLSVLDQFVKLMTNSYNPDVICVTGGLMKSKDVFFKKLVNSNKNVKIVECKYCDGAGIMGAATYALQCAKII